ncbi:MAG: CopM family metallochaperone, partial [Janthinobacterium lividum]
ASAPPGATSDAATTGYRQAMKSMMEHMDTPYSGNPDRDFVVGMLPHHQGAIDMAEVELKYGRDPALRAMARDVIASQGKEQQFMRAWLAKHPVGKSRP